LDDEVLCMLKIAVSEC